MTIELNDINFEKEVLGNQGLVIVDFWAEWCGPCKMLAPILDKVAKKHEGQVIIGKLDVDANPNISSRFGIRSIPTLLFFKNGIEVGKSIGVVGEAELEKKISEYALV